MGKNGGVEKLSIMILVLGVAVMSIIFGLGELELMPYTIQTATAGGVLLFLLTGFLASEVFVEEKIKSIGEMNKNPFAMLETLVMAVAVVIGTLLISEPGSIPHYMSPVVGVLYILMAILVVVELRR